MKSRIWFHSIHKIHNSQTRGVDENVRDFQSQITFHKTTEDEEVVKKQKFK